MSLKSLMKGEFRAEFDAEGNPDISKKKLDNANARKEAHALEQKISNQKVYDLSSEKSETIDYAAKNLSIIRSANETMKQAIKQLETIDAKPERSALITSTCEQLEEMIDNMKDEPELNQARENLDRMISELKLVE